tara:strand:- start:95 stop:505 length:411 start_codon:yes stop_codon:yes gene_type:complete
MELLNELKQLSIDDVQSVLNSDLSFSYAQLILSCNNIDIHGKDIQLYLSSYYILLFPTILNNSELSFLSYHLIHNFDHETFIIFKQLLKTFLIQDKNNILYDLKTFKFPSEVCPEFQKHYNIQKQLLLIATNFWDI